MPRHIRVLVGGLEIALQWRLMGGMQINDKTSSISLSCKLVPYEYGLLWSPL